MSASKSLLTDIDSANTSTPTASKSAPWAVAAAVVVGLSLIRIANGPIRDIDSYWHILAGRELLSGLPLPSLGQNWSFAPDQSSWHTTQWLSEVLFAFIEQHLGLGGLALWRLLTAAIALTILARNTLRFSPVKASAWPFALAAAAIGAVAQERPNQVTVIGSAVLGGVLLAGLTTRSTPRIWLLASATILWANFHGGWVLVPIVCGLISLGRILDQGRLARDSIQWFLASLLLVAVSAISPAGLSATRGLLTIGSAASRFIEEWQPVTPTSRNGWLLIVMLFLFVLGWMRSSQPVPRSEFAAATALLVFSCLAWRNLPTGSILLAPLLARRLSLAFPVKAAETAPGWHRRAAASIVLVSVFASIGIVRATEPVPEGIPLSLIRSARAIPGDTRVLNSYNIAGPVLFFGEGELSVGIDGRTEHFGADYIKRYSQLLAARGPWQELFEQLDPEAAILSEDEALSGVLVRERNWKTLGHESGYVLLVPPDTTASV
jgi:hypothetical protein